MKNATITLTKRTPTGAFLGRLSTLSATELGSIRRHRCHGTRSINI